MNLNITGHHVEVTPAIREYVTTKLDRESPEAKARFAHNHALAQELRARVAEAADRWGSTAVSKQRLKT